jgi:hypothetical protein
MTNYSFQSSSFGSGGGGAAENIFEQADVNHDGRLDLGEFRSLIGKPIFWNKMCVHIVDTYYYFQEKILVGVVLVVVQAASNRHHSPATLDMALMLASRLMELSA